MGEVRGQQDATRLGVRNDAVLVALAGLGPDAQQPVGGLDIACFQRTELLASKRRIVGQRQHAPVA